MSGRPRIVARPVLAPGKRWLWISRARLAVEVARAEVARGEQVHVAVDAVPLAPSGG